MCPMKDVVHGRWGKKFDKIADALAAASRSQAEYAGSIPVIGSMLTGGDALAS